MFRNTEPIAQSRALRLTINGRPAVQRVHSFRYCEALMDQDSGEVMLPAGVEILTLTGVITVDNTIEEVAALWDAAAPTDTEKTYTKAEVDALLSRQIEECAARMDEACTDAMDAWDAVPTPCAAAEIALSIYNLVDGLRDLVAGTDRVEG